MEFKADEDIGNLITRAVDRAVARALGPTVENVANRLASKVTSLREASTPAYANYYLDEAGDAVIFDPKGRIIIGTPGCSRYYMLGLVEVANPYALARDVESLRATLIADPYFRGVPSFDPSRNRTAKFFHAKDDPQEVRREVFHMLLGHNLKFSAVVNDKRSVLEDYVLPRQQEEPNYRYNPNEQYDYLVKCLVKGRLHKNLVCNIHFASRGKADRTKALRAALLATQKETNERWNIANLSKLNVSVHKPWEHAGCQAVDYFLWGLQRLYERHEERFFNMLVDKVSCINDRTKRRDGHHGGVFYTRKKPLTLAALKDEIVD